MRRTLHLKKEALTELGGAELQSVVGGPGTHITCYTGLTRCGDVCDYAIVPPPTYTCTT